MADPDEIRAIVLDLGSSKIKAGFAGDDFPQVLCPTIVAQNTLDNTEFVGELAEKAHRSVCKHSYPINNGVITNWDDMEKIWHHTFYSQLRVSPEEHPVLLTEPPLNPRANRERMTELMFDTFDVPRFYVAITAVLSLYASGRTDGVVVMSGDGCTHVVPVFEGYALPHAIVDAGVSGYDVGEYLKQLLMQRGYSFGDKSPSDESILIEMKEQLAYVALDFEEEVRVFDKQPNKNEKVYKGKYEDGRPVEFKLRSERFMCTEILFDPSLIGKDSPGIHKTTHECWMKCDVDMRTIIYNNVVLAGGNTMYPGFTERMQKELRALTPMSKRLQVFAPPERKRYAWFGGSILASLSAFEEMWITKEEYDVSGPGIVHTKCL